MDDKELLRYSRHILLPEFGRAGQQRLVDAHVLLIGAGGLGSPASLYLASAGFGTLTVCDGDTVDLTNLQRQIVHRQSRLGVNKAVSAAQTLQEINPHCRVQPVDHRVGLDELMALVAAADVVVDACDNFETRYAVNRACVANGKPLVSGAAVRYSGQLCVFDRRQPDAACYHCLFPKASAAISEPCEALGVFAPLTGIIGAAQAGEAIRLIATGASPVAGKLVLFDALSMDWQSIKVARDPQCAVCGDKARVGGATGEGSASSEADAQSPDGGSHCQGRR